MAGAIRLLVPDAAVDFVSVFGLPRRYRTLADLRRALAPYDHVFSGAFTAPLRDGTGFEAFKAAAPVIEIPVVVFPAFHPDLVYVHDRADRTGQRLVQSGIGDYHSALVLFAWLEGLGEGGALRLFDPDVYRGLGYLDLWEPSAAALVEAGRRAGHDLSADLLRWSRRGLFMHSTNHPRMFVAADLARAALARAGIAAQDAEIEGWLPDEFIRQGTFPVYPAVATQYGVPANELFLTQSTRSGEPPRTMTLERFVAASFASYARHLPADLACPRVAAWRADPAIWAALRRKASARS